MHFNTVKPDLIKYEMRVAQGMDVHQKKQKRPGGFARLLSGMGKVLGSVAAPLSFLFPPAAIGAAAMYGVGTLGDQMQQRAYLKQFEHAQRQGATVVAFPGLDTGAAGLVSPASAGMTQADAEVMSVLNSRNRAMMEHAHNI